MIASSARLQSNCVEYPRKFSRCSALPIAQFESSQPPFVAFGCVPLRSSLLIGRAIFVHRDAAIFGIEHSKIIVRVQRDVAFGPRTNNHERGCTRTAVDQVMRVLVSTLEAGTYAWCEGELAVVRT